MYRIPYVQSYKVKLRLHSSIGVKLNEQHESSALRLNAIDLKKKHWSSLLKSSKPILKKNKLHFLAICSCVNIRKGTLGNISTFYESCKAPNSIFWCPTKISRYCVEKRSFMILKRRHSRSSIIMPLRFASSTLLIIENKLQVLIFPKM